MKVISLICVLLIVLFSISRNKKVNIPSSTNKVLDSCFFNEKQLYGKIKFVEHAYSADIKVKFVNSFPDLKVKFVDNFANDCGEWEVVENNADLNVFIVTSFEDIKVKTVESFPGLN